nr:copper amine oxidase N-terminal domain-containing protein [Brevibacillus borstelensis]
MIKDSRALVPLRPIAEGLGFDVNWNSQTRTGLIQKGDAQIKLIVSRKIAKRNGEIISLDVPAQIVNQRTMVPVRFIAEALSYDVNWDGSNQTVLIKDKAEEGKAPASLVTSPERKQE